MGMVPCIHTEFCALLNIYVKIRTVLNSTVTSTYIEWPIYYFFSFVDRVLTENNAVNLVCLFVCLSDRPSANCSFCLSFRPLNMLQLYSTATRITVVISVYNCRFLYTYLVQKSSAAILQTKSLTMESFLFSREAFLSYCICFMNVTNAN